jgi:UDP-N-acetylglucosamine 4,6-dehydratase
MEWQGKNVLITGGTGSFGSAFLPHLIAKKPRAIRIYSRDEHKQSILLNQYGGVGKGRSDINISGLIGDVRDKDRLQRACEDIQVIIHACALKQVQSCEYNPLETIKTNVMGSMNIIDAALDNNVEKVLAISTDKAVSPLNLYGASKMCMERLMTTANSYRGTRKQTKFCSTRYGNVADSRGTIVPIWREMIRKKEALPITNVKATRFWIPMKEANKFVMDCIELMDYMDGGEIFVPKIASVNVMDVYQALTDGMSQFTVIGDRIGDKLHEVLISKEEATHTVDIGDKYIIYPEEPHYSYRKPKGYSIAYQSGYSSDINEQKLSVSQIKTTLEQN